MCSCISIEVSVERTCYYLSSASISYSKPPGPAPSVVENQRPPSVQIHHASQAPPAITHSTTTSSIYPADCFYLFSICSDPCGKQDSSSPFSEVGPQAPPDIGTGKPTGTKGPREDEPAPQSTPDAESDGPKARNVLTRMHHQVRGWRNANTK